MRVDFRPAAVALACAVMLANAPSAGAQVSQASSAITPAKSVEAQRPRIVPLDGQSNFRDLGGYRTTDGREVKWGMIYRSGELSSLNRTDYSKIAKLGIRTVVDLRTQDERAGAPTHWQAGQVQSLVSTKPGLVLAGGQTHTLASLTPDRAKQAIINLYSQMPVQYAPEFRMIFQQLLKGDTPLLFHCTAGKDRSGLAAALILTTLGVPQSTVLADYELTNRYLTLADLMRTPADRRLLQGLPDRDLPAFLAADPAYLKAAFSAIQAKYGSVDNYLAQELSIGLEDRLWLRKHLLN